MTVEMTIHDCAEMFIFVKMSDSAIKNLHVCVVIVYMTCFVVGHTAFFFSCLVLIVYI